MPVEIRELHIRVAVSAKPPPQAQPTQDASGKDEADRDAIVAECVEQVLQIMQAKKER